MLNYPRPGAYGRVLETPSEPQAKPANYCPDIPPPDRLPVFEADSRTVKGGGSVGTSASMDGNRGTATVVETVTSHATTVTVTPSDPGGGQQQNNPSGSPLVDCPTDGALVCLDDKTWAICNWGKAAPQPVAAGTRCVGGKIVSLGGGSS